MVINHSRFDFITIYLIVFYNKKVPFFVFGSNRDLSPVKISKKKERTPLFLSSTKNQKMDISLSMTKILKKEFNDMLTKEAWLDMLINGKLYDFEEKLYSSLFKAL